MDVYIACVTIVIVYISIINCVTNYKNLFFDP